MIITNIIVVTIIIMTTCNYSYKYYTFFSHFSISVWPLPNERDASLFFTDRHSRSYLATNIAETCVIYRIERRTEFYKKRRVTRCANPTANGLTDR